MLVHGRSQQGKDPARLEKDWLDALAYGLARADKTLPPGTTVDFPYYGDLLAKLVKEVGAPLPADVTAKGAQPGGPEQELSGEILEEIAAAAGIVESDVERELPGPVAKGPGNWEWVQGIARALDRVPGLNARVVQQFTRDVSVYLSYPGVRAQIDAVLARALGEGPVVVVAHSLGTVVSYNVLKKLGSAVECPRFVTLGSPLGIRAIRRHLGTLESPAGIASWFNAFDDRDLVALVALDARNFGVTPPIENKSDVINFTDNRHGIAGYLADPIVAAKIAEHLS